MHLDNLRLDNWSSMDGVHNWCGMNAVEMLTISYKAFFNS